MTAVPPRPFFRAQPVRVVFNVERAIAAEELNAFYLQAKRPPRNLAKLQIALAHSLFCVTARQLQTRELVGHVRVCGDGVFNAEIVDLLVWAPGGSDEAIKKQLILRLKREVRRTMPKCAISTFAAAEDLVLLLRANFEKDPEGIRAMALPLEGWADEPAIAPGLPSSRSETNSSKTNPSATPS